MSTMTGPFIRLVLRVTHNHEEAPPQPEKTSDDFWQACLMPSETLTQRKASFFSAPQTQDPDPNPLKPTAER